LLEVGDTLGRHRIVSRISEGGMATLYLASALDAPGAPLCALKVIHPHLSEDWQFVRMFVDEALISVRLRHPNVVRVDELGEENGTYYLVMEYVHGCTLAQVLRRLAVEKRRMRPELAVWIASEVAAGLHAAHETSGDDGANLGVIHRDVSPQNVMLSVDGEVKLLDFGIAKARGRAERTETGVIKGKVRYMAPEQALGRELDRRVDVYALGVVLWEMLTMRRYIEGRNDLEILRRVQLPDIVPPSFRADGIDPRLDAAVLGALALSASARPDSADALRAQLVASLGERRVGALEVAELVRHFGGVGERPSSPGPSVADRSTATTSPVRSRVDASTTDVEALTRKFAAPAPPPDDVLGDGTSDARASVSDLRGGVPASVAAQPSGLPAGLDEDATAVDPSDGVAEYLARMRLERAREERMPTFAAPAQPARLTVARVLTLVLAGVVAFSVGTVVALVTMRWLLD
jgi:serine/threonine-protein kinase